MGLFDNLFGSSTQTSSMILDEEGKLEQLAREAQEATLPELQGLVGEGAGVGDVAAGAASQRSLAEMLKSFSQGGFMPGQEDISVAQNYASSIFSPQQVQLNQSFDDAQVLAGQQAAALGRPVNDPILQAKLAQSQAQQQQLLGAQQTAFSAQQAQNMPLQRLQFAAQGADVSQNLAQQALQNRQSLLQTGASTQAQQQQFRINTATTEQTQSKTPGLADIAGVGLGAIGGFAQLGGASGISGLFSGDSVAGAAGSGAGGLAAQVVAPQTAAQGVPFYLQQNGLTSGSPLGPQTPAVTPGLQGVTNFFNSGATSGLSAFQGSAPQGIAAPPTGQQQQADFLQNLFSGNSFGGF